MGWGVGGGGRERVESHPSDIVLESSNRQAGRGPSTGWVSIRLGEKEPLQHLKGREELEPISLYDVLLLVVRTCWFVQVPITRRQAAAQYPNPTLIQR